MKANRSGLGLSVVVLAVVVPLRAQEPPKVAPKPAVRSDAVLEFRGSAAAAGLVRVSPAADGRVVRVFFEEGSMVSKGDVLVQLDDEMAKAELEKAAAALKTEKLAAAERQQAELAVTRAKQALEATSIRAPLDGIVLTRTVAVGDTLKAGALLCEMTDLSTMEIEMRIPAADVSKLQKGQNCRVIPDAIARSRAFQKKHRDGLPGVLSHLEPVADVTKEAVRARVTIKLAPDEAGVFLKPGMTASVLFPKSEN